MKTASVADNENTDDKQVSPELCFGRLSEEKGIDTLLKVCRKLPHIPYVIAGTGPLEEKVKALPNVSYVGFKTGDELRKLIEQARFSVYPSKRYENCPFSVMESQKYGTAVLGANIGGIPELIQDGITGALFENGNADYLEKLGLEPGKFVLSVGRITPEKGFDTLIKAFGSYASEDMKLVIAGSCGTELAYMRGLEEISCGRPVIFPGYVSGEPLAQLYSNAALYVLSSNNEGFPMVLLEAMSYGIDVLVSDIPATRLFPLDEDDYFSKGDYEALGEKLQERLKQPRQRRYELDEYDWNRVAEQVLAIYRETAE